MVARTTRPLLALLFAAAAVAARLPFLATHKIPFDSDEAVEGLMASHVLQGELPAFFWAQAFKGVPEVYASAGVFALAGPSVIALKSVTLAMFAAYVALNFVLLDRTTTRWTAVSASLLLVAAPPALVFWSLDASAEYILIMLLGTALLLLSLDGRRLFSIGLVIGIGLWVHQLFIVYLLPLGVLGILRSEWWKRREFGPPNRVVLGLAGVAAIYLGLGLLAFVTGGFSWQLGPLSVGARAPQKMLRIAAAIAAFAALAHAFAAARRDAIRQLAGVYWPLAAGVVIGYLPVLIFSLLVEPARSPARNANLRQLLNAAPDILGNILPILAGFKIATTERLAVPAAAAIPGVVALAAYFWSARRTAAHEFFPLFGLFVPVLFVVSGAYVDTQSYRYLIPWYAGLAVAWAREASPRHGWQGSHLAPRGCSGPYSSGPSSPFTPGSRCCGIECCSRTTSRWPRSRASRAVASAEDMRTTGQRKLTFLSNEAIIVAPSNGVDRYPAYTHFVRSLPAHERMEDVTRCE